MKYLYWRPNKCSRRTLIAIGLIAVLGMTAVELFPTVQQQRCNEVKLAAARRAQQCMQAVRQRRLELGCPIDRQLDPTGSGMIGPELSRVTSIPGHLGSKQASVNPNFAAVVVDMLVEAGVQAGDRVAVGYTGSLPCLDLAVCAALDAMQVEPVIIASAASSQYGANLPDLMWLDMERLLWERGLIGHRAVAASFGGYEDSGLGMSEEGRQLVLKAIQRSGVPLLDSHSFDESLAARLALYEQRGPLQSYAAYINVGGGTVSTGRALGKKMFQPGLNLTLPSNVSGDDSVMAKFAERGVPVIHLVEIHQLARHYGLTNPVDEIPQVGQGGVFTRPHYNRWLTGAVLAIVLGCLYAFVLTDRPQRLAKHLGLTVKPRGNDRPQMGMGELMV